MLSYPKIDPIAISKVIAHERPYRAWVEACDFRSPGQYALPIGRKFGG